MTERDSLIADLYERHLAYVRGFCVRKLGDTWLADEATHDTFERALRNWRVLAAATEDRQRGWLARVAFNRCIDLVRSGADGLGRTRSLDSLSGWEPMTDQRDEQPELVALDNERNDQLVAVMAQLSPEHQAALMVGSRTSLTDVLGVAADQGITRQCAKSRCHRARVAGQKLCEQVGLTA